MIAIARAAGPAARVPVRAIVDIADTLPPTRAAPAIGVVDPRDHAASMLLTFDYSHLPQAAQVLGGGTWRMAMILDGQHAYDDLPQSLVNKVTKLGGKPWVEVNVGKGSGLPDLSPLGVDPTTSDPSRILQELRAGADSVTTDGQPPLGGVQTTHYRAELSLQRLLPNLPSSEQALLHPGRARTAGDRLRRPWRLQAPATPDAPAG